MRYKIARPSSERLRLQHPPRNLVTIYVEGLQANLLPQTDAQGQVLMPALNRFAAKSVRFANFFNAVTPTINAIVSSQCGTLIQVENATLEQDRGLTRDLRCLPDLLHEAGYYQIFMGGSDSHFSGKRAFLAAHQFDEVWGWEDWSADAATSPAARNAWGLHDTDLARRAVARLPALAQHQPFHLALLTVNTHSPASIAPDCPAADDTSPLLAAFGCTDTAIQTLLDGVAATNLRDDTVIVIMGDHTLFPTTENRHLLGPLIEGWYGRVFFAVSYPGATSRTVDIPSYSPDFAAIAMDALGFESRSPIFVAGRSALVRSVRRDALLAPHFHLSDARMIPTDPGLVDECSRESLGAVQVLFDNGLTTCERERLIAAAAFFTLPSPDASD